MKSRYFIIVFLLSVLSMGKAERRKDRTLIELNKLMNDPDIMKRPSKLRTIQYSF